MIISVSLIEYVQVGDDVMIYLLRHSSVFLGLSSWKHQQVTGPAIGDLVNQLRKYAAESQHQQSSNIQLGNCIEYLVFYNVFHELVICWAENDAAFLHMQFSYFSYLKFLIFLRTFYKGCAAFWLLNFYAFAFTFIYLFLPNKNWWESETWTRINNLKWILHRMLWGEGEGWRC